MENKKKNLKNEFLKAVENGDVAKTRWCLEQNVNINIRNAQGFSCLIVATNRNDVDMINELLLWNVDINQTSKDGCTALHFCCMAGYFEIALILVESGANVNIKSFDGSTALHFAARENRLDLVQLLLDHGADETVIDQSGDTPTTLALRKGNAMVASALMNHEEEVNDTSHKSFKMLPLHAAVKRNDLPAVLSIIKGYQEECKMKNGGAPSILSLSWRINETIKNDFTALHLAGHYGCKKIAEILIKSGANVNFQAKNSVTALHMASKWGHSQMVSCLLDHSADIDCCTRDKLTPLHCACRSGHTEVANILLRRGALVSAKTKSLLSPLHMAVQGDHLITCQLLLDFHASLDDVTCDFLTPLHVASHCGNYNTAKFLLDSKCQVDPRAKNGFTPLHVACRKNRKIIVDLLLRYKTNVEASSGAGLTPLHVASFLGHIDIVKLLLNVGAHVDCRNMRLESPLHLATRGRQLATVELLLSKKANVNAHAQERQTALHTAAHQNNVKMIDLLIKKGANVNACTSDMHTPLHVAVVEENVEAILSLLNHGAHPHLMTKKGLSAVHLASKYNKKQSLLLLLEKGCEADTLGRNSLTSLLIGAHYGHLEIVQVLLKYGANVHHVALNGYTALHIAAKKNRLKIAEELLKHGLNVHIESKNGFTPVHIAANEGHETMVQLLLAHGARSNCASKNGLTPLHLAAQEDHIGVAQTLVLHNAQINSQTKAGYTPLHTACHFGRVNMINFLLSHNADPNIQNNHGYSPLHQAAQQGHVTVINILLKFKANPNLLSSMGTAYSIARQLDCIEVAEALKSVTKKHQSERHRPPSYSYKINLPEMMQECNIMELEDNYAKKRLIEFHESMEEGMLTCIKKSPKEVTKKLSYNNNSSVVETDLAVDYHYGCPTGFMVDMKTIENELNYATLAFHNGPDDINSFGLLSASPISQEVQENSLRALSPSQMTIVSDDFLEHLPNMENLSFKNISILQPNSPRNCRHFNFTPEPMKELSCNFVHPFQISSLPSLPQGQALASWIIQCFPVGKHFSKPVKIVVPHFASLNNGERELQILMSFDGSLWQEHNSPSFEQEEIIRVFEPTFGSCGKYNKKRIIEVVTMQFPLYFALVSRVSESSLKLCLPGSILRPPSPKFPVFIRIGHQAPPNKLLDLTLSVQNVSSDLVINSGQIFNCSSVITVKPFSIEFTFPVSLTISCPFLTISSITNETENLRLYCNTGFQWQDITTETKFILNTSSTVVTFLLKRGGKYLLANKILDRSTLIKLMNQLNMVPFFANVLLLSKKPCDDESDLEFEVICGTADVIDALCPESETSGKLELLRSGDIEMYHDTSQSFDMKGSQFQICETSPYCVLFQAFKQNSVFLKAKMCSDSCKELLCGCITIYDGMQNQDNKVIFIPKYQEEFGIPQRNTVQGDSQLMQNTKHTPTYEQLPPIVSYCVEDEQKPFEINFEEFSCTATLPKSIEVVKCEYIEETIVEPETVTKVSENQNPDGSLTRTETSTTSSYQVLYKMKRGSDLKEVLDKKLLSIEVIEKISVLPKCHSFNEADMATLKSSTIEKELTEYDEYGNKVNKKIIKTIYQAPKPKISTDTIEGEVFSKSSVREDLTKLSDQSAIVSKMFITDYYQAIIENVFINGMLKNSTSHEKYLKNEIEEYLIKLPSCTLDPLVGMCLVDIKFDKKIKKSDDTEKTESSLMVEIVPEVISRIYNDSIFEEKKSKTDIIVVGPVECRVEKSFCDVNLESNNSLKSERWTITYIKPYFKVNFSKGCEKKRLMREDVLDVEIIDNNIQLPCTFKDNDKKNLFFDTKTEYSSEVLPSGYNARKKTLTTVASVRRNACPKDIRDSQLILCPVEKKVQITGVDKYCPSGVFEHQRTLVTSWVQPAIELSYFEDAVPAMKISYKDIEVDVKDVLVKLDCGTIESHSQNAKVSIIVVPTVSATDSSLEGVTLKRIVYDVKIKPPRTINKIVEGDLQIRNKMEEFVRVADDGTSKSHFKVITAEHLKPLTVITEIDGRVTNVEKKEKLIRTNVKENIFEMPTSQMSIIDCDVDIKTTSNESLMPDSSVVSKTTTKMSLSMSDKNRCETTESTENGKESETVEKKREVMNDIYENEYTLYDGTTCMQVVKTSTHVEKHYHKSDSGSENPKKIKVLEENITEEILEIPPDIVNMSDPDVYTKTTDKWMSDNLLDGTLRTKHIVRTRAFRKSKNFDCDVLSRSQNAIEELEGEIQIKMEVQESEKKFDGSRFKHKIVTKRYIRPVTILKYSPNSKIPEIGLREDLMKIEIDEYVMELDGELCKPEDCVSTIDNYSYIKYLPNGVPVNTEVTKITARLKREKVKQNEVVTTDSKIGQNSKQKIRWIENEIDLPDGSVMKCKTVTKDHYQVDKKKFELDKIDVCETLLKTEIEEYRMILPKERIDLYASNCITEIFTDYTKSEIPGRPATSKLVVETKVKLKAENDYISKSNILNVNQLSNFMFAVRFGETIVEDFVTFKKTSENSFPQKIRTIKKIKSRPYYTLMLNDKGEECSILAGIKTEDIEVIETIVKVPSQNNETEENSSMMITNCKSEQRDFFDGGIFHRQTTITCQLDKKDPDSSTDVWIIEGEVEKRVDILKDERHLCSDGSLKQVMTFEHKHLQVISTVSLTPEMYAETKRTNRVLDTYVVNVTAQIFPGRLNDEDRFNVEIKTSNDLGKLTENTTCQMVEMLSPHKQVNENTFKMNKFFKKISEDEKMTHLDDGTLVKWKTLMSKTFLNVIESRKVNNGSEDHFDHNLLTRIDMFIIIVEINPNVFADSTGKYLISGISKDSSALVQPDGNVCHKKTINFIVKKEDCGHPNKQQSVKKKSEDNKTIEILPDGSFLFRNVTTCSSVESSFDINKKEESMLNGTVLSREINEDVLFLSPNVRTALASGISITTTMLNQVEEVNENLKTKRRVINVSAPEMFCNIDQNSIDMSEAKARVNGIIQVDEDITEITSQFNDQILNEKTWKTIYFRPIMSVLFKADEFKPEICFRNENLCYDLMSTSLQIPANNIDMSSCDVNILVKNNDYFDSLSSFTNELITSVTIAGKKELITDHCVVENPFLSCARIVNVEEMSSEEDIFNSEENITMSGENITMSEENITKSEENITKSEENIKMSEENITMSEENITMSEENIIMSEENIKKLEESRMISSKDENVVFEKMPDGSIMRTVMVTTKFFKKPQENTCSEGNETICNEEEIPIETVVEKQILYLPPEMAENSIKCLETEIVEIKDEDEREIDGLLVKQRTVYLKLIPESCKQPKQVTQRKIIEEVQPKIDIIETEELMEDGRKLKKKIIFTKYIKHVTEIALEDDKEISSVTSEQLISSEIEEIYLILPSGLVDGLDLGAETTVDQSDEILPDCTPLRKKIINLRVFVRESQPQKDSCNASSQKRIEGDLLSSTNISENSSIMNDGTKYHCKKMVTRFFRPVVEISVTKGHISDTVINEETSCYDVHELITEISADVDDLNDPDVTTLTSEDIYNEKTSEGISVKRTVKTNKIIKSNKKKDSNSQSQKNTLKDNQTKSVFPRLFLSEHEVNPSKKVFTQILENEPVTNTEVKESVNILPDGTKVKKRITKTVEKRTIVRRLAIEGGQAENLDIEPMDVINNDMLQASDNRVGIHSNGLKSQCISNKKDFKVANQESEKVKTFIKNTSERTFLSETTFAVGRSHDDAYEFFDSDTGS